MFFLLVPVCWSTFHMNKMELLLDLGAIFQTTLLF